MRRKSRILRWVACAVLAGCAAAPAARDGAAAPSSRYQSWPEPLELLPHGPAQTELVCARPGRDSVRDALCGGQPAPTSLAELQARLGVGSEMIEDVSTIKSGDLHALSISGHSTALGKRGVSAINPRLIALHIGLASRGGAPVNGKSAYGNLLGVAFARGEQFAELVAGDYDQNTLNFYVVGFRQACNAAADGCKPVELLTAAIESDWTEATLYDEIDLADSVLDCAPCHQTNGPGTPKLLRMQELDSPWTHWFSPNTEGGKALLQDFTAAHGDETYAGMSARQIAHADPNALASMVFLLNPTQPNEFDSLLIEGEVKRSAAAQGGDQPLDNSITGTSETWGKAYAAAARGEAIAVPYLDVKVTDAVKLASMTAAYESYRAGQLGAAELPDIRDVFPDDPERLGELGIYTQPGLDGASVLLSACSQCHNARLDQSLSRARFRADLQGVSRAEKDLAIERLQLPPENPFAMPPARLRVLTPEARERALAVLRE